MLDGRNHPIVSIKDKLLRLLEPGNFVKMVMVQQDELKAIKKDSIKSNHVSYIEYLFNHYIEQKLPKTYLC